MTAEVWLRLSPQGRRSGLVVLRLASRTLTVTVLPKAWRTSPGPNTHDLDLRSPGTSVVAHELDFVRVRGSSEDVAAMCGSVAARNQDDGPLVVLGPPPQRPTWVGPVGGPHPRTALEGLLDLVALADCGGVRLDGGAPGAPGSHALLRVLLHRRFVDEAEAVLASARPRYVTRDETLSTPRGRIDDYDVAWSELTGGTTLRCTFDGLTADTPCSARSAPQRRSWRRRPTHARRHGSGRT